MYEHSAAFLGGPPNDAHLALYSAWSKGDWGMIITGNVQVSPTHLSLGRDMVIPTDVTPGSVRPFAELASAIHGGDRDSAKTKFSPERVRPVAIMQLSHAGRQSPLILGGRAPFSAPLGPSEVPLGQGARAPSQGTLSRLLYSLLFQTPQMMTELDIDSVVEGFARGARLAHVCGFDGVELHASHGCEPFLLLSYLRIAYKEAELRPPRPVYITQGDYYYVMICYQYLSTYRQTREWTHILLKALMLSDSCIALSRTYARPCPQSSSSESSSTLQTTKAMTTTKNAL